MDPKVHKNRQMIGLAISCEKILLFGGVGTTKHMYIFDSEGVLQKEVKIAPHFPRKMN